LKGSRNEQRAVIRFCGEKDLLQMAFIRRCVLCTVTSVLRDEQYMFGVNFFRESDDNLLWRRPTHQSQQSILSMNLDDTLKNETLIWTFKLVTFVC